MSKLKFIYAVMGAGKTAQMINAYEIYKRKGLNPVIIKPATDDREGAFNGWGKTASRLMKDKPVDVYHFKELEKELPTLSYGAIFVDEAQFLTRENVIHLAGIVDEQNINVLTYGLKTDINGNLFEGSASLLALADEVSEMEALCQMPDCNNIAQLHLRFVDGKPDTNRDAVAIEKGNVTYKSICRKCWNKLNKGEY
jgi:thymidine kinase